ncbi:MAG: GGDEF domain-containing protein [Gammaproteobacteria bacterium]|nr:GGDEF domain-containing protein [Gammaproteobacteria bacterium]
MRRKFQIQLPQTIEFRSGKLTFHQSVVLFSVSLVTALILLAHSLNHLIEANAFQALAHSVLLILLVANLAWFRMSLDLRISNSIFLAILFGHNSLAILSANFAFIGLFWASLFPLLAFILKGFRGGLIWTALMGLFILSYYSLHELSWLHAPYPSDTLVSLLLNYGLISLMSAVLWSWNKQLVFEEEESRQQEFQANHDSLTGLLNRPAFLNELEATIEDDTGHFALLLVDLDCVKAVNNQYGKHTGDKILTMAAKRLAHALRATDLLGRYGSDEFLILLRNIKPGDAQRLKAKLEKIFQAPFYLDDLEVKLGMNAGISYYPQDAGLMDELVKHADMEMMRNKLADKVEAAGLKI